MHLNWIRLATNPSCSNGRLCRHVAIDPLNLFKFSQSLENLFENVITAKSIPVAGLVTKF